MSGQVKVTVDSEVCIGVGQCEMLAPEVFGFDDDEAISFALEGVTIDRDEAEGIIDQCPSGAISIIPVEPGEES